MNTVHARIEDFAKENRENYDIAMSRAVAALNILLEYLLPLVKVGGTCICMKGSNVKEEIANSKNALEILGGKIEKVEEIILPESDMVRNIVIIKKVKNTPTRYPRKAGIPVKEPL
jgi:16S rRNA (guanine527-N7)-methyltransferase